MVISKRFVEVDDVSFGKWNDGKWLYSHKKKNVFDEMFKPHISLPSGVIDVFSLIKPFPVVSSTSWYGYAWFGRNYRGTKKTNKKTFMHVSL